MDLKDMQYADEKACNAMMNAVVDCNKYYKVLMEMEDYPNRKVKEQIKMATYALNMTFQIIGEHLNKLSANFIGAYLEGVDIQAFYKARNMISHNYEAVNMRIVKGLVHEYLPDIEYAVQMFKGDCAREIPYTKRDY